MRKTFLLLFTSLFLPMFLMGCASQEPITIIKHIVVAPSDDLLVDCDVAKPPVKSDYLKDFTVGMGINTLTIQADPMSSHTLEYVAALLKNAKEHERMLTDLNLQHYQNVDACNQRLKNLRAWKQQATQALADDNHKE